MRLWLVKFLVSFFFFLAACHQNSSPDPESISRVVVAIDATFIPMSFVNGENVSDLFQYLANLSTVFTCHKISDTEKNIRVSEICTLFNILLVGGRKIGRRCVEGVICFAKSACSIKAQSKTL